MPTSWKDRLGNHVKLRRQYGLHKPGTEGLVTERCVVATKIDGTGVKTVRVRLGNLASYRLTQELFEELFETLT